MGNLKDVISKKLSLVPCVNKVDHLVIATVSNWGSIRNDRLPGEADRRSCISFLREHAQVPGADCSHRKYRWCKQVHVCTVGRLSGLKLKKKL